MKTPTVTIGEYNMLIAHFEGYNHYHQNGHTIFEFEDNRHRSLEELEYDRDWNWLMRVVVQIEGMEFIHERGRYTFNLIKEEGTYTCIVRDKGNQFIQEKAISRISAMYMAVVEFIVQSYSQSNKRVNWEGY